MPYWENYLCTKPEVDDDDLPLPEHRIFDDYGNLKVQATRQARSLHGCKAHATAATKRHAYALPRFLRVLFSKPNTVLVKRNKPTLESAALVRGQKESLPKRSVSRKSTSRSISSNTPNIEKRTERRAGIRVRTPAGPETLRKLGSPVKRQSSPKTGSRSPKASPSHGKRGASPVPVATSTVAPRSASASRSRSASPGGMKRTPARASRSRRLPVSRKRSSRTRSVSRGSSSNSPRKRGASQASGGPNSKWAVVALREYAKENEISTRGLKRKSDILLAIQGARP